MANFFFPEFDFPNQRSSGDIVFQEPEEIEIKVPVGQMVTPHLHPNTDEILKVIRGNGIANLLIDDLDAGQGDLATTTLLRARIKAGDMIFFPRGNPHWILNPLTDPFIVETNPPTAPQDLVLETSFENPGFDTLFVQSISTGIPANVLAGALGGAPGDLVVPF